MMRIALGRPALPASEHERLATLDELTLSRLIATAGTLLISAHGEVLAAHGLTVSDFEVMRHLAASDRDLSLGDVAAGAGLGPPTVTAVTQRLRRRGLVHRKDNDEDRRAAWLCLTEDGRGLLDTVLREMLPIERAAMAALPDDELEGLRRALVRLLGSLLANGADARPCSVGSVGSIGSVVGALHDDEELVS